MAYVLCILPYMQSIRNVDRRFEGLPEKDMPTIAIASPSARRAVGLFILTPYPAGWLWDVRRMLAWLGLAWRGVSTAGINSIA